MATPCVPTLGSQTFLTDIGQILVYQFRSYIYYPKNRSNIYKNKIKSFMSDLADIGYDKTVMAKTVENSLGDVYSSIFANSSITVNVSCEVESLAANKYNLYVTITANDGNTVYTIPPTITNSNGDITIANDTVYKEVL